jgi:hypothetical protein
MKSFWAGRQNMLGQRSEVEINGLMTYDRKVIKIPADELKQLHRVLY